MEEIQPKAPTVKQFEKALSKDRVPSLADKAAAVALNALATADPELEPTISVALPYVIEALEENRYVVQLLTESRKLLTILKIIQASGGTVHELPGLYKLMEEDFLAVLKAAPNLKTVTIPRRFSNWDQLGRLLNRETLEQIKLRFASPKNLDLLKGFHKLQVFKAMNITIKSGNWDFLSQLKSLEDFEVQDTNFKCLAVLRELKNLKVLLIWESKVKDWKPLTHLSTIEEVSIVDSKFSDTTLLRNMTHLKRLYISKCPVKVWTGLTQLSSVESLRIEECEFPNTSALKNMNQLKDLEIFRCKVDDWSGLSLLSSVEAIEISSCTLPSTSVLKNMSELTTLDLGASSVEDWSGLSKLLHLRTANLPYTSFDYFGWLEECKELSELDISHTKVDLSDLPPLPLKILRAESCSCSDNGKRLESLGETVVNLDLTSVEDIKEWSFLTKMTALEELTLADTNIDDLSNLENCENLRILDIAFCTKLTDLGPLATLPSLREVHLDGLPETVDTSPLDEIPHLTLYK